MAIYVYDTIPAATNLMQTYSGPLVELECRSESLSKVANAAIMFGENSVLETGKSANFADFLYTSLSDSMSLVDNIVFKTVVIALFVYYCFMIFHFRDCLSTLFKIVKMRLDKSTLLDDSTYIFMQFLRRMTFLWVLLCGVMLIRMADYFAVDQITTSLMAWALVLLIVPAVVAIILIMLLQKAELRLVSKVTQSLQFAHRLSRINVIYRSLAVLTITPVVLLLALYNGKLQEVVMYIIAAEVIVVLSLWLYKTYTLFLEQNVSILHWFLYLCAIEIFPFTLLILISLRLT